MHTIYTQYSQPLVIHTYIWIVVDYERAYIFKKHLKYCTVVLVYSAAQVLYMCYRFANGVMYMYIFYIAIEPIEEEGSQPIDDKLDISGTLHII